MDFGADMGTSYQCGDTEDLSVSAQVHTISKTTFIGDSTLDGGVSRECQAYR
jgi:hypothetical protein